MLVQLGLEHTHELFDVVHGEIRESRRSRVSRSVGAERGGPIAVRVVRAPVAVRYGALLASLEGRSLLQVE